ncbi:MAG TPA: rRNA maturation RNase YbeY [Verrucomicrobiae bacterium]|nr:rRNA maturation RNase YbeY [Verrucomicrobiae bacterium]
MNISISNCQRVKKIDLRLLKKMASAILAELKIEDAEIEINLVGAKEMAEINWQFLRHEGSTDVITFDYSENTRLARTLAPPNLSGELFICVDDAITHAKQFKTNWQSEIVHYIIHGILHLLGHDDLKPALRRKMKRKEDSLLRKLSEKFSFAQVARQS